MENNNILIAEFMGINHLDDDKYINNLKEMKAEGLYFEQGYMTSELKFDTDWNWLMQVVEKTLTVGDDTNQWDNVLNELQSVDIKNVYEACIEFIKWYNENK
jgi:hypothetical protein